MLFVKMDSPKLSLEELSLAFSSSGLGKGFLDGSRIGAGLFAVRRKRWSEGSEQIGRFSPASVGE